MVRMYNPDELLTDEWFTENSDEPNFVQRTPRTVGLSIALIGASALSRTRVPKGQQLERLTRLVFEFTSLGEPDSAALSVFALTRPTSYDLFRLSIEVLCHEFSISEYLRLSERLLSLVEIDNKMPRSAKHWLLQYYLEVCACLRSHSYWSDQERDAAHESLLTLMTDRLSRERLPDCAEQEYIDRLLDEGQQFRPHSSSGSTLEIEGPGGEVVYSAEFQRAFG